MPTEQGFQVFTDVRNNPLAAIPFTVGDWASPLYMASVSAM